MRAIDRLWFGVAVLLVASAIPADAQLQQVAWEDLPARMADRLIPVEQMGISECPKDLGARLPDRRVLQYIENVLYSWEEYDLEPSGLFCVVMQRPQSRVLTAAEAQVLLSASSLWVEEQETILES